MNSKKGNKKQKQKQKYVYVLGSTQYIFRYKIGISNFTKRRVKNISESIKGDAYKIISLPMPFFCAKKVESALHRLYKPLNAKMYGSGKTEWFWFIFPVTPIILLVLAYILQLVLAFGIPFAAIVYYYINT